tara:strand:- start:27066 stop:27371 length:306 start_codon:yes stop_codon:yes gene_type:complete
MLSVLKTDSHSDRLRDLSNNFRSQERFMTRALLRLQEQLDAWHEANEPLDQDLFEDLCLERNELATELSHVRMAIAGAREELAHYEAPQQLHTNDYELLGA